MPTSKISAATLAAYDKLIATTPEVERKGAGMPYTSRNGHMFSFLADDGKLALRLPPEELDSFLKKHKTKLCEQHGRVMKEYAVVPKKLLTQTKALQKPFQASFDYVGTLKPKPTKRTAKKKTTTKKSNPAKTASNKKSAAKKAKRK